MKRVTRRAALAMLAAEREWRSGSASYLIDLHRQIDAATARAERADARVVDLLAALERVQAERDSANALVERQVGDITQLVEDAKNHAMTCHPRGTVLSPGRMSAIAAAYHASTEGNRP